MLERLQGRLREDLGFRGSSDVPFNPNNSVKSLGRLIKIEKESKIE